MSDPAKKALSERDICTKYITPALLSGGKWDQSQIREEVSFTKGRVLVRGIYAGQSGDIGHLFQQPQFFLAL